MPLFSCLLGVAIVVCGRSPLLLQCNYRPTRKWSETPASEKGKVTINWGNSFAINQYLNKNQLHQVTIHILRKQVLSFLKANLSQVSLILQTTDTHCNEGINQRYLKNWADVADKICFSHTWKFGSGSEFSAMQWRLFTLRAPVSVIDSN